MYVMFPIVSIVVPFGGLPFRFLNIIKLVRPKKGTTMETIGTVQLENGTLRRSALWGGTEGLGFRV